MQSDEDGKQSLCTGHGLSVRRKEEGQMNQPTEETTVCEKQNASAQRLLRKRRAVCGVFLALLALLAVPVLAWLYIHRSVETMARVNMPYAIRIGAGNAQDVQQLELGNIDVSGEQRSKDVVFCVYSDQQEKAYDLQLAHTTNIGFTYTIYKASMNASGRIRDQAGNTYQMGEPLNGSYLNKGENGYADTTYHEKTYGTYQVVQKSAEPLYWKTEKEEILPETGNGLYVNYYILHISWDETVRNNKETDMIYLMAG